MNVSIIGNTQLITLLLLPAIPVYTSNWKKKSAYHTINFIAGNPQLITLHSRYNYSPLITWSVESNRSVIRNGLPAMKLIC